MPLLDHDHPPLSRTHKWRSFHTTWAVAMARLLNAGVLPPGYVAAPCVDRDGPIEIDVAARHETTQPRPESAATEPQPWSPGEPQLSVAVEWPTADEVRVEILTDDGDPRLAAAVELVGPRNEDRAKARAAFAAKCADRLGRGCGGVVVDVVTTRHANAHAEILATLGADPGATETGGLAAVSYRSLGGEADGRLEVWAHALELGRPLPTVPLWLNGERAVPLDLEASYTAACADLRIRQAG